MTEQLDAGFVAEQIEEHPEALDAPDPSRQIGLPRKRKEDRRLITGRTRWTDNIQLPGLLHMAVVRSTRPHARLLRVDTVAAEATPGVVRVVAGPEAARPLGHMPYT